MSFLLDTDICSAHLRGAAVVSSRLLQYTGRLSISAITLGELYVWALRRKSPRRHLVGLEKLLSDVSVIHVDGEIARRFGEIRAQLLDVGRRVPIPDLWIAATGLAPGLTVVTHNTADFEAIPGLAIADWLMP